MGILLNGSDYYDLTFVQKRKAFLDSLMRMCDYKIKIYAKQGKYKTSYYDSIPELKLDIIKSETEETEDETYDGYNFNPEWNNREILLSEAVIEFDFSDFKTNLDACYGTALNLIRSNVHFAFFYAEGMKCPHIHIYDLFPEIQDYAIKNIAMALFCRKVVPFEYFHKVDKNLWEPHKIALEFAKHWRTGHIKKLLFEHIPEVKNQ